MGVKGEKMTVKDVIKQSVLYLGESNLLNTTILDGTETADDQQTDKLNLLLTCVNDVVQTLALMYFPLKYEEKINNSTGKFNFSSLQKDLTDILKIVDEHGYDADFAMFPTYFETKKGIFTVIYNYLPAKLENFTDNVEVVEGKVSLRLLALGTVSRYFLMCGMFNDAEAWESMFERAILVAQRAKTPKTIKKRRWL